MTKAGNSIQENSIQETGHRRKVGERTEETNKL